MIKVKRMDHVAVRIDDVEATAAFYSEGGQGRINPFGAHLALEVEDFAAARQSLDDQGVPYVEAPPGPPTHQLWLLDPSGNTVELWADRAA